MLQGHTSDTIEMYGIGVSGSKAKGGDINELFVTLLM